MSPLWYMMHMRAERKMTPEGSPHALTYSKNLREKEKAGLWQTIIWI